MYNSEQQWWQHTDIEQYQQQRVNSGSGSSMHENNQHRHGNGTMNNGSSACVRPLTMIANSYKNLCMGLGGWEHSKSVDLTWDVQQEKALPEGSVCDGSELISCPLSMCSSLALPLEE